MLTLVVPSHKRHISKTRETGLQSLPCCRCCRCETKPSPSPLFQCPENWSGWEPNQYPTVLNIFIQQGCALAEPSSPCLLPFALSQLGNLITFFHKNQYVGHPGFHRFIAEDSLLFFFEHSLDDSLLFSAQN